MKRKIRKNIAIAIMVITAIVIVVVVMTTSKSEKDQKGTLVLINKEPEVTLELEPEQIARINERIRIIRDSINPDSENFSPDTLASIASKALKRDITVKEVMKNPYPLYRIIDGALATAKAIRIH